MSENYNYCHIVGKTDVGRQRSANEDNMFNAVTINGLVSVVCDGMGGHVGGATASSIAVSTIIENLNNIYYEDVRVAIGESIDKANKAIIKKTEVQPELSGMGSTCVLLLVRDGKVYYGHVGDSRIYLVRSRTIRQLTKDHSFVQMLVDCGELSPEQAEHHPRKNEITNALGIPDMRPATVANEAIIPEAGDCFVLCSDGLSGMVSDNDICKVISRQTEMSAQERVDRLVEMANENGGVDNITIQLVEFSVSPKIVSLGKKLPLWLKVTLPVVVTVLICAGGYYMFSNNNYKPALPDSKPVLTEEQVQEKVASINKVDTTKQELKEIEYKKGRKIVEFEFANFDIVNFKRGNRREKEILHTEKDTLDFKTLNVITPYIETAPDKKSLFFTEKNPGEDIVFYISASNGKKVYEYTIPIKGNNNVGDNKREVNDNSAVAEHRPQLNGNDKQQPDIKDIVEEIMQPQNSNDTICFVFDYSELAKGVELKIDINQKNSFVSLGKDEKKIEVSIEELFDDEIKYNGEQWNFKNANSIFLFTFNGDENKELYDFVISYKNASTGKKGFIKVSLKPKKESQPENQHGEMNLFV